GGASAQDFVVLLDQARRRACRDLAAMLADGLGKRRIDREVDPRRQRDGAQHPDRIFLYANIRTTNGSDNPCREVFETAHIVDDPAVSEELLDLRGMGRGADGEVLGAASQ